MQQWRLRVRDEQRRSLEHYVSEKNEEEGTSFHNLSDMYVDLRMLSSKHHYKRLEERTRYDNLNLLLNIETYPKINLTDLFVAEGPEMTTPVRTMITGSAGIGKTSLCLHIVEKWLEGDLLSFGIHQVFLVHLRHLTSNETCSIEDLFFKYQCRTRPSTEAIGEFFKQLQRSPDKTLLILDGWDEIKTESVEKHEEYDNYKQVDMPTLVASIINRSNLPSLRVFVTSRSGIITNPYIYDKGAAIFGFTRETMSNYIMKFSGDDHNLQKSLENYIDHNPNIRSLCYIPVHFNLVCRIMKYHIQNISNRKLQLPETITELYIAAIGNMLANHNSKFKLSHNKKTASVVVDLKDHVLNHANLAKYGMTQVPIGITFSTKNVQDFYLRDVIMECGLMTETRQRDTVDFIPTTTSVYYFHHLTLQEFMAALGLLSDVKQVGGMISTASGRQLDLMLMFLAGLLGNNRTHGFLSNLKLKPTTQYLDKLITVIVKREQRNEAIITNDVDRSKAHKANILWLMMIIYESKQVHLWRKMSDYALDNGKWCFDGDLNTLDLSKYELSPTELHALAYVLPETHITALR